MKQDTSYSGSEANSGGQTFLRTPSPMLLPPADIHYALTQEEESVLAKQIAEYGDEYATVKLYKSCLKDVFYYFYRKTQADIPETEDLTSETLLRAMEGLRDGSWSGQPFRAWLFIIAKYVFFEWLRAKQKRSASTRRSDASVTTEMEQVEEVDLLDEVLIRERGTVLWQLVRELPEQDRQVLFLRYVHGLRYAEIAEHMGCTEKACRTRHWRALKQLREKVLQAGLGEEFGFGENRL